MTPSLTDSLADEADREEATLRVRALMALTEELTDIIVEENACLQDRRPAAIAPLQADKARLAAAYAQSIREIAASRGAVSKAGDNLLQSLRELTRTFEGAALRQRALLDGASRAAEGVLRIVAEEAGRAAPGAEPRYGASAVPTHTFTQPPIAIDAKA